ncbi:hypothetical protein ACLB2K_002289 [Fragaria x ananassa]
MTVNEKKFIETALESGLRIDGRRPFDYRTVDIKFGKDDGSAEVHLGQTHVMAFVTAQLVQPYRDRPNEGTLSIFTEFSPMADPSFEPGRPAEYAVELGRVIDRGLRESRAVDTESLCILSAKLVWAVRVDLHILDNGGNLIDAANIAALAGLLTFRRPECSLGGENGQEVIIHPPEEREPLHLIIHHLPIAVTFGFFSYESSVVIDPTHHEEAVMGGRMTATLNSNGDVCAIQKAGGEGILQGVIMQCLRIAAAKAGSPVAISSSDKETSFLKPVGLDVSVLTLAVLVLKNAILDPMDPYSMGVDSDSLKASLGSQGMPMPIEKQNSKGKETTSKPEPEDAPEDNNLKTSPLGEASAEQANGEKTLKDAVKAKNRKSRRKSRSSSGPS